MRTRLIKPASVFLLTSLLLIPGLQAAHSLHSHHVFCIEHGAWEHVGEGHASNHKENQEDLLFGPAAERDNHERCEVTFLRKEEDALVVSHGLTPVSFSGGSLPTDVVGRDPSRSILDRAPKNSPPL